MNKTEIAQMLTIASGFDRRQVDTVTVEAWALVADIAAMDYQTGVAAVVAHQTGARAGEYLQVHHIVDYAKQSHRDSAPEVEADVRSARARRLVEPTWPVTEPLPAEIASQLLAVRNRENLAAAYALEVQP
jgi:hypothetical protein